MNKPHTLFISDLHLCQEQSKTVDVFLNFLKNQARSADALYILGDFFEVWIGDDDLNEFNVKIIEALQKYTALGIPTYFMHGNRDFLIGKRFAKLTGIQLLKEPNVIQLYDTNILLLHGDSLCTRDIKHQKARKIMHNRFYQKIALALPLTVRKYLAKRFRNQSQNNKRNLSANIMDVTPEEVLRVMQESNVKTLIHGHTHRPAIHEITINQERGKRIVLGAWHHEGSYLRVDKNGESILLNC